LSEYEAMMKYLDEQVIAQPVASEDTHKIVEFELHRLNNAETRDAPNQPTLGGGVDQVLRMFEGGVT
jgi:hypothetical protein